MVAQNGAGFVGIRAQKLKLAILDDMILIFVPWNPLDLPCFVDSEYPKLKIDLKTFHHIKKGLVLNLRSLSQKIKELGLCLPEDLEGRPFKSLFLQLSFSSTKLMFIGGRCHSHVASE